MRGRRLVAFAALFLVLAFSKVSAQEAEPIEMTAQTDAYSALIASFGAWGAVIFIVGGFVGRQFTKTVDHRQRKEMIGVTAENAQEEALAHQIRTVSDTIGLAMVQVKDANMWAKDLTTSLIEVTSENVKLKASKSILQKQYKELEMQNSELEETNEIIHARTTELEVENVRLQDQIKELRAELDRKVEELESCITKYKTELEELKTRYKDKKEKTEDDE